MATTPDGKVVLGEATRRHFNALNNRRLAEEERCALEPERSSVAEDKARDEEDERRRQPTPHSTPIKKPLHQQLEKHLSAKQALMAAQKAEAAQKVREEKARLKEEKRRQHEAFLAKQQERQKLQQLHAEARRDAIQQAANAALATKELEIRDRQWQLEQERLHRQDMEAERRRQRRLEQEMRTREREEAQAALLARREREAAERRRNQLLHLEELENQRLLEEAERLHRRHMAEQQEHEREKRRQREDRERAVAQQEAQESRALDAAAYKDVQQYLEAEKARRRQSIAVRIREDLSWKDKNHKRSALDAVLEARDRELERAAYLDMKRYLAIDASARRQSLSEYLRQENESRMLQGHDRGKQHAQHQHAQHQQGQEQGQERRDDGNCADTDAAQDADQYLRSDEAKRRLSNALLRARQASDDDVRLGQAQRDADGALDTLVEEDPRAEADGKDRAGKGRPSQVRTEAFQAARAARAATATIRAVQEARLKTQARPRTMGCCIIS